MKARISGGNLAKSVKDDIRKEFVKLLDKYNYDAALQVLYILHFEFGFGEQRLRKFAKCLEAMQTEMKNHYELEDEDTPYLCGYQLEEDRIDFRSILKGE